MPAGTKQVEQTWFAGVHSDIGGGYDQPILCEHLHQSAIDRYECGEELDVEVARFLGVSREQARYQPANLQAAMDRLNATV